MLIIVSLMLAINSFRLIHRSQFVQNLNVRLASTTVDDHDHIKHVIKAELKKLSKAQVSLTTEALNSKRCEEFSSRASLIVSNLYRIDSTTKQSIVVESYDDEGHPSEVLLKFNTEKFSSPKDEADWLFTKARKMRRGTAVVSDLLKSNEKKQAFLEQALSSPLPTEELKDQLISSKLTSITSFSPPSPSPTPTPPHQKPTTPLQTESGQLPSVFWSCFRKQTRNSRWPKSQAEREAFLLRCKKQGCLGPRSWLSWCACGNKKSSEECRALIFPRNDSARLQPGDFLL